MATLLRRAQGQGFLGPAPVEEQLARSLAFAIVDPPTLGIDLGSGGGIPALVLALLWVESHWTLIESNERRAGWLETAALELGMAARCHVACERAEVLGRGKLRTSADLVTARSFASPGPTAECAAPFLRLGGRLLVAEPPGAQGERWPEEALSRLGLALVKTLPVATGAGPTSIACLESQRLCPDIYPRRLGVPFKRPLF